MTKREGEQPIVDLGRALEWALYWIRHCAEVPVPLDEQDEWERWEEASRALRTWGPESGYAAEAYLEAYRAPFRMSGADDG